MNEECLKRAREIYFHSGDNSPVEEIALAFEEYERKIAGPDEKAITNKAHEYFHREDKDCDDDETAFMKGASWALQWRRLK